MQLLLAFMLGVVLLSILELRGRVTWRTPVVLLVTAVVSLGFLFQRVV
jgi:hypothetical protein